MSSRPPEYVSVSHTEPTVTSDRSQGTDQVYNNLL